MSEPFAFHSSPNFQSRPRTGEEKLAEVSRLMRTLDEHLTQASLDTIRQVAILGQLRIYGRDPKNAGPIFCNAGIRTLSQYAFDSEPLDISREALRCIANALLLDPRLRQVFVDLGYSDKAADRLKKQDSDDEFLISRILFLLTYNTSLDFDVLFDSHFLVDSMNSHLARHAKLFDEGGMNCSSEIDTAALSESLKLLFNLTNFYPQRKSAFSPSIESIFVILEKVPIPNQPLQAPINYLINALANLELGDREINDQTPNQIFPKSDQDRNVGNLITILDRAISVYKPEHLETLAMPLLTVLREIYQSAPEGPKKYIQSLLLPGEDDRDLPIGQSETLPSRLLRLSVSPLAPTLRESISSFMFELSGKDATEFVRKVGYGFAAGFLMSHHMPIPENAKQAHAADSIAVGVPINPITGQRLDKEPVDTGPEMTLEEKEREAERLFVLFERLKATGVVDVQNPVEQAMREGKFDRRIEEVDEPD